MESPIATPKMNDWSSPIDFSYAINTIHERYPNASIYIVGLSMGGNLAVNTIVLKICLS